ncbi:Oxidase ustYa [Colletotrichum viniferum]|nr:Oxidase ustYa [Colletotrichum viniferum]
MKKTLVSEPIYGGLVTNESEKAWDALMPLGRGFVVIKNQTALPQVPKFNATMGEYKGVISVFHQLHCVVSEELGGSLGWGYQHQCYDYDALKTWAEDHSWGDDNEKNIQ